MSEIEQANGIEIPEEVLEAAAKALHDFEVEYDRTAFNAGAGAEEWVEPAPFDPANPIGVMYIKWAESAFRTALDAWGATVETRHKTEYPESERRKAQGGRVEVHPRVIERRTVTPWREVP